MRYEFKPGPELLWAIMTALVFQLALVLSVLEPSEIVDWRIWAVTLAGSLVRAAAGAVLSFGGAKAPAQE